MRANAAITVNKPVAEVYRFWRDFRNLPAFMAHLEAVEVLDERRSRWTAKAPAGVRGLDTLDRLHPTWDVHITDEEPDAFLAWRSVEDATVESSGWVRFQPAPGRQGTEVTVDLDYHVPRGKRGEFVTKLVGDEPTQQAKDHLRRFKQVMEVGEVVVSDGNPDGSDGAGAGTLLGQKEAHPV